MRLLSVMALTALVLSSCRLDVTGAPCSSDESCPMGQRCGPESRCVLGSGAAGGGTAGGGNAGTGGGTIAPVACASDSVCQEALAAATTSPAGCAEASCVVATGRCEFRARDNDSDGERAAGCSSETLTIATGPDCQDTDATVKAGSMQPCVDSEDGGLLFPLGMPVGKCVAPIRTCDPGGSGRFTACVGGVLPVAPECASTDDFSCNGVPDSEDCGCTPGTIRPCYSGPSGTRAVGLCSEGTQTCVSLDAGLNGWTACAGDRLPAEVQCASPDDSNCNGRPDGEDCGCQVSNTRPCYPGDGGPGVGVCVAGVETCELVDAGAAAWGVCAGAVTPRAVNCSTSMDNDCNGTTDDVQCGCQVGSMRSCYNGPNGTAGVGICRAGTQECQLVDAGVATWSTCTGAVLPAAVNCSSPTVDNNCNGQVDSVDCGCQLNATRPCYTGPTGTQNVGLCRGGTQTCISTGSTSTTWGACSGQVIPTTRNCTSSTADADCNGQPDVIACGCQVNTSRSCYTGPSGTANVGSCRSGTQTCNASGVGLAVWGSCTGQVTPASRDTCNAGEDNDCNGVAGNGCVCYPVGRTDTTGCPGNCVRGTRTCLTGGNWGTCSGAIDFSGGCSFNGQQIACSTGVAGCSGARTCSACTLQSTCNITSCVDVSPGSCTGGCAGGAFGNTCNSSCSFTCPAGTTRRRVDVSPAAPSNNCNPAANSIQPNSGDPNWNTSISTNASFNTRIGVPALQGIDCRWTPICRGPL